MRSYVHQRHRGRMISVLGGMNRFARVLGPTLGGYISSVAGQPSRIEGFEIILCTGMRAPFVAQALIPPVAMVIISAALPGHHASSSGAADVTHLM